MIGELNYHKKIVKLNEFNVMILNSYISYAHNGATKRIQLIDEFGCPVDDKLISRFRGSWSDSGIFETQVYAYMKTFRFTGSPALYIECDVRMCHGRCPVRSISYITLKFLFILFAHFEYKNKFFLLINFNVESISESTLPLEKFAKNCRQERNRC
jgi:hypothetical protein